MRLLVTNDDGIESEGMHVLAAALAKTGHEVVVVAPDRDWSGAGASLGRISPDERIEVERVELPDCGDVEAWALAGPPALTVVASRLGAFGDPPDLVVSGINAGLNTGRSTLHSGTVGAALTAQNFGLRGLAVSVKSSTPWRWDTAASIAVEVLDLLIDAPPRSVLNLNVPALDRSEVKGIRWARLAHFGSVRSAVSGVERGSMQFELRPTESWFPPDSDQALVADGFATLTTLAAIVEAWPPGGLEEARVDFQENVLPGAPLETVHRVPDAREHRTLHRPRHEDDSAEGDQTSTTDGY